MLLPYLEFYEFGVHFLQIEYSPIFGMYYGHFQEIFLLLMIQTLI
jgi:hypothetical protein